MSGPKYERIRYGKTRWKSRASLIILITLFIVAPIVLPLSLLIKAYLRFCLIFEINSKLASKSIIKFANLTDSLWNMLVKGANTYK